MIAAESAPCEGACWATAVAAAGASAEPVPPSEGTAKKRSESGVGGREKCPAARTAIDGGDGGRFTSDESPRSRKVVNLHTWLVGRRSRKSIKAEGSTPKIAFPGRGTIPPNTGGRRGTRAKPAGPDEEDTDIIHGGEATRSTAFVFRSWL